MVNSDEKTTSKNIPSKKNNNIQTKSGKIPKTVTDRKTPSQRAKMRKSSSSSKKKKPGKLYSIIGELKISTGEAPQIQLPKGETTFKTAEMLVDSNGDMFTKASLDIQIDDKRVINVLDAEQVELLLKLLRVIDYAD
jgi:hypothetical protein